jgi:uncharacterized lipoprotein
MIGGRLPSAAAGWLVIGLLAALTAACSSSKSAFDCELVEQYQEAQSGPTVSVPAGLSRPDESTRLNVPPGPLPAEPLSQTAGCLQRPPEYFDKPLTKSDEEN